MIRPLRTHPLPILALAVILAGLAQTTLAEDPSVGRLFFTPERRQALDRQRLYNIQDTSPTAEEPVVTLNGVVKRSSGRRTAWLNGVVQHDNEDLTGTKVKPGRRNPGRATLEESGGGNTTTLSVGDSHRRGTEETVGLLPEGSVVRINPPSPSRPGKPKSTP